MMPSVVLRAIAQPLWLAVVSRIVLVSMPLQRPPREFRWVCF